MTGLDFSAPAIRAAGELSRRAGIEASWVEADVYDAVEAVGGTRYDIVYTGLGALNWLPDIERWARVMAGLLAPGGRLYMAEFHPFAMVFGDEALTVSYPYFHSEPLEFDDPPGTYADLQAPTVHNRSIEWIHPIGSVVSALTAAGLRLEFLHEHDHTLFQAWPFLEPEERGIYRLPADMPSLPLMYSLRAVAPPA